MDLGDVLRRVPARDVLLGAALAAYALFEVLSGVAPGVGAVAGDPLHSAVAAAVASAAVALRHAAPLVGFLAYAAALTAEAVGTEPAEGLATLLAGMLLSFAVGAHCRQGPALVSLVIVCVVLGLALQDPVFLALLHAAPWLGGRVLGERQRQLEAVREQEAAAVEEERRRLARELHDVVSHGLTLVVVQAQLAGATVRTAPDAAEQALAAVTDAARGALADMRRLLALLDPAGVGEPPAAPQPGLDDVPALVDRFTRAGLHVALRSVGQARTLAPGVSLTAYRVVQEALTNTLRHAGPATAEVLVRWTADDLEVLVRDTGSSRPAGPPGRGLTGLRERLSVFGGDLTAGPSAPGGFEVRAVIPA